MVGIVGLRDRTKSTIYIYKNNFPVRLRHFSPTFRPFWPSLADISILLASFRRHLDVSSCSRTTFRRAQLFWDISTYPAARGRHFLFCSGTLRGLSCCSRTSCCSGTTFRPIPLRDDISTYPATLGHSNALTFLGTLPRCQHSSQIKICDEVDDIICDRVMHASLTCDKIH